jgi:ABC-2 type transport system ATP-binding protein
MEVLMLMIKVRGLEKSFRTRQGVVEAVCGVDLRVEEGQVFGFLGPNGAGKTTTLRILATLLLPDGGRSEVAGCDLLEEPARVRERIGYVGQAGGADVAATGRENLVLQARLYGSDLPRARERATWLIGALDLEPFADRPAKTYSGGQRRRLDLGLGLVHEPSVLFLDEPTTGLDPQSRARLWEEVGRLSEAGMTVFLTTHYMDEADALCDRVAIIDDGRVVIEDSPDGLKRRIVGDVVTVALDPENGTSERARQVLGKRAFVRELEADDGGLRLYVERSEEVVPEILKILDAEGVGVRAVSLSHPSLDDVFLHQTGRSLRETGQDAPTEPTPTTERSPR